MSLKELKSGGPMNLNKEIDSCMEKQDPYSAEALFATYKTAIYQFVYRYCQDEQMTCFVEEIKGNVGGRRMSKNEFPDELKSKLDEFHVEVPDIPLKRSKWERLANWIHAPAKNPLDALRIKEDSIIKLVLYPMVLIFFICLAPLLLI